MGVGGSEFFIAEQRAESQGGQNSVKLFPVGNGDFDLFSDLVTGLVSRAIDRGACAALGLGRTLVGEYGPGELRTVLLAGARTWVLDAEANELAAPGQVLLRGVIEGVEFMCARGDFSGIELFQAAPQCGDVFDAEFDLDFLIGFVSRHDGKCCSPGVSGKAKKLHLKSEF